MNEPIKLDNHIKIANVMCFMQKHMRDLLHVIHNSKKDMASDINNIDMLIRMWHEMDDQFSDMKNQLDSDFHSAIHDDEHKYLGNIYYNLDKRYNDLSKIN